VRVLSQSLRTSVAFLPDIRGMRCLAGSETRPLLARMMRLLLEMNGETGLDRNMGLIIGPFCSLVPMGYASESCDLSPLKQDLTSLETEMGRAQKPYTALFAWEAGAKS